MLRRLSILPLVLFGCDSGNLDRDDAGFFVDDAGQRTDVGEVKRDTILVKYVFDGDTIKLSAGPDAPLTPDGKPLEGENVRLLGVDAPEIEHPPTPAECWGPESSAAARDLLLGRQVRLEYDPAQELRDGTESHRLLAYVILVDGGQNANGELIRQGHACSFRRFAHRLSSVFNGYESEAETANRGFWASCTGGCD
ncbi:MAG: thermonuclease family protein [Deltaproteobacteria bacterium]|nr:thermonuclease family protein [Deltaproteobacteria bacterium]